MRGGTTKGAGRRTALRRWRRGAREVAEGVGKGEEEHTGSDLCAQPKQGQDFALRAALRAYRAERTLPPNSPSLPTFLHACSGTIAYMSALVQACARAHTPSLTPGRRVR